MSILISAAQVGRAYLFPIAAACESHREIQFGQRILDDFGHAIAAGHCQAQGERSTQAHRRGSQGQSFWESHIGRPLEPPMRRPAL